MKNLAIIKTHIIITIVCAVAVLICITIGGLTGDLTGEFPNLRPAMAKANMVFITAFCLAGIAIQSGNLKRLKA